MNKQDIFIEKIKKKHGDSIDTSKIKYINSITKVCLICRKKDKFGNEHGEYWQTPSACVRGNTCPKCANEKRGKHTMTTELYKEKEIAKHGNRYILDKVEYKSPNDKICIICPEHGEFWQLPYPHLNGQGCPKCNGKGYTTDDFKKRATMVHNGKYNYDNSEFVGMKVKISITCPEHGEFLQTPYKHLHGQGCPICAKEKRTSTPYVNSLKFEKQAKTIHDDKYHYHLSDYIDNTSKIRIICPIHGEFWQRPNNHLQGCGCPKCSNQNSKCEDEIIEFISPIKCERHNRTILNGKEIDIYIPSLKLGIEYNGLRWHSEEFGKDRNYHLDKLEKCNEQGINLIQIFEDEWINHKDIVKSKILNLIGKTENRIYARKCIIKEVLSHEANEFLSLNHLQGKCNGKYRYGLYYNGELVSLMVFGKMRKNLGGKHLDGHYELIRFCNKINTIVVGGASKLFKYFLSTIHPKQILSYADRRYSNGNLYKSLGFEFSHKSQPSYFYNVNGQRKNRFSFRKDVLVKEGYDASKSEHQIMIERGIYRIYDCGCLVFKYNNEF